MYWTGYLWYLHVKLYPTVNLFQDKGKLMDFLLHRSDCKMVILSVCSQSMQPIVLLMHAFYLHCIHLIELAFSQWHREDLYWPGSKTTSASSIKLLLQLGAISFLGPNDLHHCVYAEMQNYHTRLACLQCRKIRQQRPHSFEELKQKSDMFNLSLLKLQQLESLVPNCLLSVVKINSEWVRIFMKNCKVYHFKH